MKVLLMKIRMS